jgi:hypothetical protein
MYRQTTDKSRPDRPLPTRPRADACNQHLRYVGTGLLLAERADTIGRVAVEIYGPVADKAIDKASGPKLVIRSCPAVPKAYGVEDVSFEGAGGKFIINGRDNNDTVTSLTTVASTQSGGRRKRMHKKEGEDDESDGNDRGRIVKKTRADQQPAQRFACPFYKHNPVKFRSNRTCRGPGWWDVHRVKFVGPVLLQFSHVLNYPQGAPVSKAFVIPGL